MAIHAAEDGQLLFEAFYSYLLPQFEGLDDASGEQLFSTLTQLVGTNRKERLRSTLNEVLGLELQPPQSGTGSAPTEPEPGLVEEES
jgi:hypothetical protein